MKREPLVFCFVKVVESLGSALCSCFPRLGHGDVLRARGKDVGLILQLLERFTVSVGELTSEPEAARYPTNGQR